ncbi:unnamed protein product [Ostreobium quekettii]|uniref:AAA+ ATPase domain-containing protein n=1 Tax=Ostreobium quekettii TaxID=121088 RepID=A0A8S1J9G0_9CHLO|nr:unnamed protein product [Ostreobium quekettii]
MSCPLHRRVGRMDLTNISEKGPKLDDLRVEHDVLVEDDKGNLVEEKLDFIPPSVLGDTAYDHEPVWSELPQMPFMEFYRGLLERNWVNELYNPQAEPWKLEFFKDSGRIFRTSFSGYRVIVEKADKSQFWVDMPTPGRETFVRDVSVTRAVGTTLPAPARQAPLPSEYGYNQVFEQIFLAYEQKMPPNGVREYLKQGWVQKAQYEYDCPGDKLLDVSFHMSAQEPSFRGFWDILPSVLFVSFAFSFLGICLAVGIFRPRKQMPTDPMQAMEFAQSKGRARMDGRTDVKFSDVAGLDTIITDLQDIVKFLQDPAKYQDLGAKPPKGVLLEGPPGTGKTLVAKAIAGEAGVPFYQMSGSEFVEAIVGVGAARVRDLFKRARAQDEACIIFVDEIDALGIKRAEAGIQTNEEREQTLNQLLTEMDGFTPEQGVVFVGATNRADLLDPALCRPGRFDRKLRVLKPDTEARFQILKVHARKRKMADDVDLEQLARDLPGLSGAELENVLNESALEAVRRGSNIITPRDVYNAVERVLQGVRRPAQPDQLEIGKAMAVHEVGRAIVAIVIRNATGRLEAVERVSMIARGKDWTRTIFYRGKDEDYTMTTKVRLLERVRVILAGRAAEELVLGCATSYAVKDLEMAYRLVEKIVCNYAMSPLGITSYAPVTRGAGFMKRSFEVNVDNIDEDLFGRGLKGGMFQPSDIGQHKMLMEIHKMLREAYADCLDVLSRHSDALEAATLALMENMELTGKELEQIVEEHPPRQPPPTVEDHAPVAVLKPQHPQRGEAAKSEKVSRSRRGVKPPPPPAPKVAKPKSKKPYANVLSSALRQGQKLEETAG